MKIVAATLRAVPGRGTPRRTIRIPEELWQAALAKARQRGEDVATVIRRALERYVRDDEPGDK